MENNLQLESIWINKQKISLWNKLFKERNVGRVPLKTPTFIGTQCKGIQVGSRNLKSFLYSTDMAIIENNDADAILAVYPFTPSKRIMKSLIDFSCKPVICGVGGGTTKGQKSMEMGLYAEQAGAQAIIVNIPFKNKDLEKLKNKISIPVVASISSIDYKYLNDKINAGVDIFHITGGRCTASIVNVVSEMFPKFPIMATGGQTTSSIVESIVSGSQAIVLSPPSNKDLFKNMMVKYREI